MGILLSLHHHQIRKDIGLQVVFSREPRIKANFLFGSYAMRRTSAPERASADWWPSRYERNEVVVAIQRCEEEFIAEAVKKWRTKLISQSRSKITCNPWPTGPVIMTLHKSLAGAPKLFNMKPDRSLRLCIDYQGVNNLIIKNLYPLSLIVESLNWLSQAKSFTQLDLASAYHQIWIKKGDEWNMAF